MPEPDGLALETALAVVGILAAAIPVVGFGATAVTLDNGDGPKTVDAIAQLAEAAFALADPPRAGQPDRLRSTSRTWPPPGPGTAIFDRPAPVASAMGDPERSRRGRR